MDGQTAIYDACFRGDLEVVKALAAAGADPTIPDKYGENCLMTASLAGEFEVVKWLLTLDAIREKINTEDENGETVLQLAIDCKKDAIATLLREHGAE